MLTRIFGVHNFALAEDVVQDAFRRALEVPGIRGMPENPSTWLMATAKNRALDHWRRQRMLEDKHRQLGHELEMSDDRHTPESEAEQGEIRDDVLRLIFIACHPLLPPESRTALTLRLLGGLTTAEIARAFLVPETTVGQRIVRAKKTLRDAKAPFEIPAREDLPARLASVLEVIYLIFNEGYTATVGEDWLRPTLCEEALRIGRILAELAPQEPEVHGLVALMELQASRLGARVNAQGEPILLMDQNRGLWDRLLIQRGLKALERGEALGASRGFYLVQAAIAACHARAATAAATDWHAIVAQYDDLARLTGSAVVELNRAVAVAMAEGPAVGLALTDRLARDGALASYHLLPSVRGDLLERLGRLPEAREEFNRAAGLTQNERERRLLRERAARCERGALQ